jgi:membrane protease YdiL (CAAX protease family)
VIVVEKREIKSLGLTSGKPHPIIYLVLVILSVIIPLVYFEMDRSLLIKVFEQILFIAFAEEVLWRGYFQKRVSDWIGDHKGILLTSFLFGLGYIISLHAIEGYLVPSRSLMLLVQTAFGGLVFGYLFYWSKSIWPGAILHLFGNVFLFRIV